MRRFSPVFIALLLVFISATALRAAATPSPFDAVHVYLVTVGPGTEVYEKFGHNMIRIVGRAATLGQPEDVDTAVNWGVFDENRPYFIWHFIQGRMIYSTEASPFVDVLAEYREHDRSIWQQELNLSAEQKERLWNKLVWNVQTENADYRYDYYRDNCSTRSRDALDEALGGSIHQQLENVPANTTYRQQTRRLMRVNFWFYTALQYVLGSRVDQQISAWQECFLPVKMMGWMDQIHLAGPNGKSTPLVISEQQLYQSKQYPEPTSTPRWIGLYQIIGLIVAAILVLLPVLGTGWRSKLIWGIVVTSWCILGGLAGAILTWLWLFTDHIVAQYNENILQFSPLMLPLIVLVPIALFKNRWALSLAILFATLQAWCNIAGLLLKAFHVFHQSNFEIIALTIVPNFVLPVTLYFYWPRNRAPSQVAAEVNQDQ